MTSNFGAPAMARDWIPLTSGHKGSLQIQEPLLVTCKIPGQNNNGKVSDKTVKQGSQDTVNITFLDQERRQNISFLEFSRKTLNRRIKGGKNLTKKKLRGRRADHLKKYEKGDRKEA